MIEIRYSQSEAGYNNCFDLLFNLKEYIPNVFFEQHENGVGAELYFFISLLHKFGMFDCKKEHYHTLIWSTHYDCVYNGIPFTMIYDEDYDIVSFSVPPENIQYKTTIAERIKQLVKDESQNLDILKNSNFRPFIPKERSFFFLSFRIFPFKNSILFCQSLFGFFKIRLLKTGFRVSLTSTAL